MRTPILTALLMTAALSACGTSETNETAGNGAAIEDGAATGAPATAARVATARLASADGSARGEARATETAEGLLIEIDASGIEPGDKGFHIHSVGRCEGPAFESAGAHWNPTDRRHGLQNPDGPHLGDLPNIIVGTDGRGSTRGLIAGATLTGGNAALLDADGASIMIHAAVDDMVTDPSGNSGDRIACGVFAAE